MSASLEKRQANDLEGLIESLKKAIHINYSDPNGAVYQSLRKLQAKCYLKQHKFEDAALSLVEALGPSARTMATYRIERKLYGGDIKQKIEVLTKQVETILTSFNESLESPDPLMDYLQKSNLKYTNERSNVSSNDDGSKLTYMEKCDGHLKKEYVMHKTSSSLEDVSKMLDELPTEWTVVQLTAGYEPSEMWQNQKYIRGTVKEIHLSILKSDTLRWSGAPLFTATITPDKVKFGETPVFEELHTTLEENVRVLESRVGNSDAAIKKYWEKRAECDRSMKGVITTMDVKWLGAWRCLLPGSTQDKQLADSIRTHIQEVCHKNKIELSPIQKMLIYKLASFVHGITLSEISLLLRKIYMEFSITTSAGTDSKTSLSNSPQTCRTCGEYRRLHNLCIGCDHHAIAARDEFKQFKKAFGDLLSRIKSQEILRDLKHAKRDPVILFVDEKLDIFPWEVLPALNSQPVTRMEGLHFTYALYKAQEKHIQNGYYQLKPNKGRYLINPGGDLERMEKRMTAFLNYWCPQWQGDKNKQPPPETFQKYLQDSDIFLYCGHNDGSQYMNGAVERLEGARAVTTLSGCSSVRLRPPGTRLLPLPVHTHYHIATCPCVVGMLWEVTDLEVDKVTSMLLGMFLPPVKSEIPHWGNVSKAKWSQGKIDAVSVESDNKFKWEPDLLRALAMSKRSTAFVTIAASVVARGIPVKIHPDYENRG